jgi:hypothetical protein
MTTLPSGMLANLTICERGKGEKGKIIDLLFVLMYEVYGQPLHAYHLQPIYENKYINGGVIVLYDWTLTGLRRVA